jgi:hypothetical protein
MPSPRELVWRAFMPGAPSRPHLHSNQEMNLNNASMMRAARAWMTLVTALTMAAMGGCASTSAGPEISLGTPGTQGLASLHEQLRSAAKSTVAQNVVAATVSPQRVASSFLVIGDVFPLHRYSKGQFEKQYRNLQDPNSPVARQLRALTGKPEPYSEAQFQSRYMGWTSLIYDSIPLVYQRNVSALVPRALAGRITYPNLFMSFEFGATGDRVLACATPWGLVEVVRRLCKSGDASCDREFHRGVYSAVTGQRVLDDLSGIDPKGRRLNLSTLGAPKTLCAWNPHPHA